jgi:hypothetical protein
MGTVHHATHSFILISLTAPAAFQNAPSADISGNAGFPCFCNEYVYVQPFGGGGISVRWFGAFSAAVSRKAVLPDFNNISILIPVAASALREAPSPASVRHASFVLFD